MNGRLSGVAWHDRPDPSARVAELEAEVVTLRRALARADLGTGRAAEEAEVRPAASEAGARLAALVELGDRLRDLRDPAEIAGTAAGIIGRTLGAARAGYGTVDAGEETIRIGRDWTRGPLASVVGDHRLSGYWTGFADALRRGEDVAVADTARDPRTARHADNYAALGIGSCLHAPVVREGRILAILYVHGAAPRRWTAAEVAFVRGAAERTWAAAERARADEELRAEAARLRLALEAGRLGAWELDVATGNAVRSPQHDAIFGYEEPPPDWGYEPFLRHVLPEDHGPVDRSFRAALGGGTDWRFECRIRRTDGEVRWIEAHGQPVRDGAGRQVRLLSVVADVTERKRAEERRMVLVAELNHRVKNTLAVVQSLAAQTARGAPDLPSFSAAFQARLIALARAHDLLSRGHWEGAAQGAVVRAALDPLAVDDARVDLSCCASGTVLPPASALALTMALHELATNALKHGALSASGGRVSITCDTDPDDGAHLLEWVERGGPPVAGPPVRRGFGLRLLERGLATQAGMAVHLSFKPEGLRCKLRLLPPGAVGPGGRA